MTAHDMLALIDRLEGHLAWMQDFGPDGDLKQDLQLAIGYLKKVCPPRDSVMVIRED